MYNYLNLNPLNEHDIDCVCRAISLATEEDYETIERQLYGTSLVYGCDELCVCCYHLPRAVKSVQMAGPNVIKIIDIMTEVTEHIIKHVLILFLTRSILPAP